MVVTNADATSVSVFLNTTTPGASTPTFSAKTDFSTAVGAEPHSVSISDFNGDGKPDFVVTFAADTKVSVYLNTTTPGASAPTFSAKTDFTTGSVSYSVSIGDLNGDGKPDLVSANAGANTVSVLFNTTPTGNAAPTFSAKTDFATGSYAGTISLGDFNGDGKPDMVVTNASSNSVSVLLNTTPTGNSIPTFSAKTDFTTGTFPYAVSVYDINNDGKPDMAVANYDANSVSVFLNTTTPGASTPTFTGKTDFTTGTSPSSVSICDLNGDGKPDMAATNYGSDNVSVLFNTMTLGVTTSSFSARTDINSGSQPFYLTGADFNGDGKTDIACPFNGLFQISVFLNTVTPGASTPSFSSATNFSTSDAPPACIAADINGDGKPDLISTCYSSFIFSVHLNTTTPGASTPTFSARTNFAVSSQNSMGLCAADFNGDGLTDIAIANLNVKICIYLNTTTPGATTPTFSSETAVSTGLSNNGRNVCAADFNGDGKPDIVFPNTSDDNIGVCLNTTTTGASTPTFSARTEFASGDGPYIVTVADFNGDGKPDIANSNNNTTSISVLLNTTTTNASTPTFSAHADFTAGSNPGWITKGDFNGDGKPDIICGYGSNVSVYLNNTTPGSSTSSFSTKTDYSFGTGSPRGIFVSDYNMDGKQDIAGASTGANKVSFFLNTADLPLPVELASFTSSVSGNNVMLNWNTVSEENNSGFEIERNSFGTGWTKIGFVNGKGTTNTPQNYSFTDKELNSRKIFIQIKTNRLQR
jgi:hypothetical protein